MFNRDLPAEDCRDLAEQALDLFEELRAVAERLFDRDSYEGRHVIAELQGADHGWLGGPFVGDLIRRAYDQAGVDEEVAQ